MIRRAAFCALAALLAAGATPAAARAADAFVGRWAIVARADDAARVQLRLDYSERSAEGNWNVMWTDDVAANDAGIPVERLRGPVEPVTFAIQREPGTFACSGSAGAGSGAGQFTYAPSARFDDALAARGVGRPTPKQSLQLAFAGATLAYVDQLRALAKNVGVADVVRLAQRGVDARYISELTALGYKPASLEQLVRMRDHGITQRFIGELAAAGYKNLSADDLVVLRDHGVTAAFLARLKAHGYANVPVRDLIRLRDAGI